MDYQLFRRLPISLGLLGILVCMSWGVAEGQTGSGQPRRLAEGVLTVVPASPWEADTVDGPLAVPGLARAVGQLDWQPNTLPTTAVLRDQVQRVVFRRPVWQLEFGFKPLRTIRVPMRQADGTTSTAVVYYLLYYVRNAGGELNPVAKAPDPAGYQLYELKENGRPVRFIPNFSLQGLDVEARYHEAILPGAVARIRQRETPNQPLYDSVTISRVSLQPSTDPESGRVWGVATWVGVDPQTDFLAVFVQGLTNGYQLADGQLQSRTLKVHFWRPGDEVAPSDDIIRVGIPFAENEVEQADLLQAYGATERLDYQWVYR